MKIPEKYRGIQYSVSNNGNGKWGWKLHLTLKHNVDMSPVISGEVSGTQDDAIAAAEAAIDKELGEKSK